MKDIYKLLLSCSVLFVYGIYTPTYGILRYDTLLPSQSSEFNECIRRIGLSKKHMLRLYEEGFVFRAELPSATSCSSCGGSGYSRFVTSKVKSTTRCPYCKGGGRIQCRVEPSYTYKDPKVQRLGSVQSSVEYRWRDCSHCRGTGRISLYACERCNGSGAIMAGTDVFTVFPPAQKTSAVSVGDSFSALKLSKGGELINARVSRIAVEKVELRHSAGLGQYRRDDFVSADGDKIFGIQKTDVDTDVDQDRIIDLTRIASANDLAQYIASNNNMPLLSLLISMRVPIDYRNSPFLVLAIYNNDTNMISTLMAKDASVDAVDMRGRSALRAAIEKGDSSLAKNLISRGASINSRDNKGITPLHVASARGSVDMVEYLIEQGARVDATDSNNRTPYDYAKASPSGKAVAERMRKQHEDYARANTLMAEDNYDDAIAIYSQYNDRSSVQLTLKMKGAHYEGRGLYQDALKVYRESNSPEEIRRVSQLISRQNDLLSKAKNMEQAARYDDALALYAQASAVSEVTRLANKVAKEKETSGNFIEAADYYELAGDWDNAGRVAKLAGTTSDTVDQRMDASSVYRRCAPATISIVNAQNGGVGLGSGFLITEDGYLLTNYHVVENAVALFALTPEKQTMVLSVIDSMPDYDLALLKMEGKGHPFIRLGNSDRVEVGSQVVAIGTPQEIAFAQSITQGIISGKRVYAGVPSFQTSVLINHGNSGGPLLDMTGKAIGITTAGLGTALVTMDGNIGSDIQGINFAIMINEARQLLRRNGLAL